MTAQDQAVAALKERLSHTFSDEALLERALTHASGTTRATAGGNNERLEFLGDRVLGLVIAHILYERHDDVPEGELARMFNAMVRRAMCTKVANILGDACEALIGAIYLDGGLEAAATFIREHWKDALKQAPEVRKDAKTALQEWAAARSFATPAYEIIGQSGPDHAPEFTVQLTVQGRKPETGVAGSRRMAEQNAAEAFLIREKIWK